MTLPLPPELRSDAAAPLAEPVTPAVAGAGEVVRGGLWYFAGQVVTLLVALAATPFVIRTLGPERYGVLALMHLLIAFLGFSDFGMGIASTRFGAEAYARGDRGEEARVIWTGLLLGTLPAAAIALALLALARPLLERALALPPHLHDEATLTLRLVAVGFVARAVTGVLNTPQLVRLRLRLHSALMSAAAIVQIALVPLALALGGGLPAAGAVIGGVAVAAAVAQSMIAARILPQLSRPRLERALVGRLARFGGALVLTTICVLLLTHGEKLLLTRLVSVEALAYYSVAFTLANLLIVPAASLFQSMLPTFARHHAAGDEASLARVYRELLRVILLAAPVTALALCLAAKPFFALWAGPSFGAASTPLFFLLVPGVLAHVAAHVPGCLLVAVGRAGFAARYHSAELVPYLLLALGLITIWGSAGAAAAWTLRMLVALPVFLLAARRGLGPAPSAVPNLGVRYVAALAILVLPVLLAAALDLSWGWRLVAGAASLAAYAGVAYGWLLKGRERAWLRERAQALALRAAPRSRKPAG